jgi:hypothetical protein
MFFTHDLGGITRLNEQKKFFGMAAQTFFEMDEKFLGWTDKIFLVMGGWFSRVVNRPTALLADGFAA